MKGGSRPFSVDFEGGGVGVVDADGIKVEAPEIELIAHLQRGQQVLLHGGGILVVLDLPDLLLSRRPYPAQQYSASKALARTEKKVA